VKVVKVVARGGEEWMDVGVDLGMEHERGAWSMDAYRRVAWRMRFGPFRFFFFLLYAPSVERCEAGPRHDE
jgi:hypothetical protein